MDKAQKQFEDALHRHGASPGGATSAEKVSQIFAFKAAYLSTGKEV
jgi:hypothetical protein